MSTDIRSKPITNRPFVTVAPGRPISFSVSGEPPTEMFVLATGTDTGLRCTVAVYDFPPGTEGPLHRHLNEDEGFFVLEGEITFLMPDDELELTATAGEFVWHPCRRRHGYRVGSERNARVLQFLLPGTRIVPDFFDRLAAELAEGGADPAEVVAYSANEYGTPFFDTQAADLPSRPPSTRGPVTSDAGMVLPEDSRGKTANAPYKSDISDRRPLRVGRGMMTDVSCVFHAFGHQTGNTFGLVEIKWGPGDIAGPHVHTLEEEFFYLLEGELTLHVEGPDGVTDAVAHTGDFVWAPRDLPHYYEVTGESGARVLVGEIPGSGIEMFYEVSGGMGEDIETDAKLAEFAAWSADKYGIYYLAPGEFPGT